MEKEKLAASFILFRIVLLLGLSVAKGLRSGGWEGLVTSKSGASLDLVFPLGHTVFFSTLLVGTIPTLETDVSSVLISSFEAVQHSVGIRAA